jgi:hydrogenase maturation factor HypF (carbamoyltransferase family)
LTRGLKMTGKASKDDGDHRKKQFRMLLIPCSCSTTFAVSEEYDRKGMHLRSFIPCPTCGKRHDPRNRLLRLDYQEERFWKVDGC